jgi:hypothetical protein
MGRINYSYNYLLSLIANRPLYRYTDSVMDSTTVLSRMSSGRQNSRVEYSTNHLISQQSGVSESDIESRIADAPPVITIIGEAVVNVLRTGVYTDQGATAIDDVDGDLTSSIVTTGSVDTSIVGTYSILYSVTDSIGQTTTATRTVYVADDPPVITMSNGDATEVYHERYASYTDLTGTAVDDVDGSLPVTASGDTVDVSTLGTYVRTYSATDSAGQTTTVTRNIIVQDTIDPTAALNITSVSLDVTVSLTSISENNCTIQVYSDSGYTTLITSATTTTETSKDLTFTESSIGTYTYYVRITDQSSNFSDYSASVTVTEDLVYTVTVHVEAHPSIKINGQFLIRATEADLRLTGGGTQLPVIPTVYNTGGTASLLDDNVKDVHTGRIYWNQANYTLYPNDNSTGKVNSKLFSLVTDSPQSSPPTRLEIYWWQPSHTPTIRIFVNGVDKGTFNAGKGTSNSPRPNRVNYDIS